MSTNPPPLLRVRALSKTFGDQPVLSNVSFDLHCGEIVGLIGPNGAGKTTLLECLAGLLPLDAGTVQAADSRPRKDVLLYVPDAITPYPELFAADVLTFFGQVYRVEPTQRQRLIAQLGLQTVLDRRVAALSKGNLKRFLLALGLLAPQPLLLLDEPFSGLDLEQQRAVTSLLRGLPASGRTLLLAIHELAHAERVCDRLLLLSGGALVGIGSLAELRQQAGRSDGSLEDVFLALSRSGPREPVHARG